MKIKNRYLEIDFIKGFFIICVVVFHFLWDLNFFYDFRINLYGVIGSFFQKLGACSFFLINGITSVLQKNFQKNSYNFITALKRGIRLLIFAIFLSLIVNYFYPQNKIIFGVIHSLAVCSIIIYPFLSKKLLALFVGILIIILNKYISTLIVSNKFLIPIGIRYFGFSSVDYFPLVPWFGVSLIGSFLGNFFYNEDFDFKSFSDFFLKKKDNFFFKTLIILGQNSFIIYILHQPILYAIFILISKIFK
jgi:uncharacterized membrane protein